VPTTGRLLGRLAGQLAALLVVLVGVGLLITKVLQHSALSREDGVDRTLAAHRSPPWTAVSGFFSLVGSTGVIIGVMVVVAVVFRLVFVRWRESVFLVLAVTAQAVLFFVTTLVISRQRPAVPHLDSSPPTSSFPSGHTGASTALYVGIAVVVAWHARRHPALRVLAGLLVLVPLCVALSRLYRGMHHPSDVVMAWVNGGTCAFVAARTVLFAHLPDALARRLDGPTRRQVPA
jgi:membrane-associated phospholipid phosphatase